MFKFDETLMDFVRRDIEHGSIPMLLGEPGIGKSSWLANLADLLHTKCFTLACNQLADKADLTGARLVPVVDDKGSTTGYKQVFPTLSSMTPSRTPSRTPGRRPSCSWMS